MSKKSMKSLGKNKALDCPFDAALWAKAAAIVTAYRLVLEKDAKLGYFGSAIEIPTVFADGKTPDDCVRAVREALTVAVASMLERGARPPGGRAKRSLQINVRLSPDEKLALEEAAMRQGYKGISEYVRAAALDRTRAA